MRASQQIKPFHVSTSMRHLVCAGYNMCRLGVTAFLLEPRLFLVT